jgi:beta-galactosidase
MRTMEWREKMRNVSTGRASSDHRTTLRTPVRASGRYAGMRAVFVLAVLALSTAAGRAAHSPYDIAPRLELNFSMGWLFSPKDEPGSEKREFDDAAFERVSVPHANAITPHETFEPDTFRFVSWYRKHFRPEESSRGKQVFADFQGVMTVADVYLNGRPLAHHEGGYTPFSVDLTPALEFDAENVLAVRVDSRIQKQVPPEGADKMFGYYLFGGIQRDVTLRVVDPLHIEDVYYTTARIQPDVREDAQVTVVNHRAAAAGITLVLRLLDSDGNEVAATQKRARLEPGETATLKLSLEPLRGIRLWDVDRPARYVAMAEIRQGSAPVDRERTWIGIRAIRWDPESGDFQLNGRSLKIRGMNRHQTFAYIGGAAPNRLQRRDARILKYEMGLNMMRASHYPPDPEFLDECDRIGLLVMDEFPAWQFIGQSREWQDNAVQAVRDMIVRDRNHPSIIVWGTRGNEASPREEDDRALYDRTYALARELDPTRPPGGARLSDAWHGKMVPEEVLTVNDYTNWDNPDSWPQSATGKPWLISEFGHPEQFPVWTGERDLLRFAFNWMNYLNRINQHPEIAGGVGWAAFDYNSPEFNTPVAVTAHHCVNDLFRLPKGFSAAALASQVDPAVYGPMVKILSTWRRSYGKVYVAGNVTEVELILNGKPLGRVKPTEFPFLLHPLFVFAVPGFEPGELVARGWMAGKVVATDTVTTPGRARRLVLKADDAELVADGADMTRLVVTAVDEQGTPVPNEDRPVSIEVKNGRFIGENPIHLEAGRIAFYIQSREDRTIPIGVRVAAGGLESSEWLTIRVEPPAGPALPLSPFDLNGVAKVK